jgi:hypothetical protein
MPAQVPGGGSVVFGQLGGQVAVVFGGGVGQGGAGDVDTGVSVVGVAVVAAGAGGAATAWVALAELLFGVVPPDQCRSVAISIFKCPPPSGIVHTTGYVPRHAPTLPKSA